MSSSGGFTPIWTKGGQELVYRGLTDPGVFAVSIDQVSGEPGTPERLFEDSYRRGNRRFHTWDVTLDGGHFIMVKEPEDRLPRRLVVVTNFFEELRRVVPDQLPRL